MNPRPSRAGEMSVWLDMVTGFVFISFLTDFGQLLSPNCLVLTRNFTMQGNVNLTGSGSARLTGGWIC